MSGTSRIERALLDQKLTIEVMRQRFLIFKRILCRILVQSSCKNELGGEVENGTRFECLQNESGKQGGEMTLLVELLMKDGKM